MDLLAITLGLFVGQAWSWLAVQGFRLSPRAFESPGAQLALYIAIALVVGVAIKDIELRSVPSIRLPRDLSIGLLAGFAGSRWFLPASRLLRRRRGVRWAIAYNVASPLLAASALLGGYAFHQSPFHFA